jgi:hypothetical protein
MRNQFFILAAVLAFNAYADNIDSYERMYAKPTVAQGLVEVEIADVTPEAVVGKSYELLTIALLDRGTYKQIGRACAFKVGSTKTFTDGAGKTRIVPNAVCLP